MGLLGIGVDVWQDTESYSQFKVCPTGIGFQFEITDSKDAVNRKGEEYTKVFCTTWVGEEKYDVIHQLNFQSSTGLPFAKGFFEWVGRADILAKGEDGSTEDLIGTTFKADVTHDTDDQGRTWPRFKNVQAVSHDWKSLPAYLEGMAEEKAKAAKAAPRAETPAPAPEAAPRRPDPQKPAGPARPGSKR
jgi:hypothetical protein